MHFLYWTIWGKTKTRITYGNFYFVRKISETLRQLLNILIKKSIFRCCQDLEVTGFKESLIFIDGLIWNKSKWEIEPFAMTRIIKLFEISTQNTKLSKHDFKRFPYFITYSDTHQTQTMNFIFQNPPKMTYFVRHPNASEGSISCFHSIKIKTSHYFWK